MLRTNSVRFTQETKFTILILCFLSIWQLIIDRTAGKCEGAKADKRAINGEKQQTGKLGQLAANDRLSQSRPSTVEICSAVEESTRSYVEAVKGKPKQKEALYLEK